MISLGLDNFLNKYLAVFEAYRNFRIARFYDVRLLCQWAVVEMSDGFMESASLWVSVAESRP